MILLGRLLATGVAEEVALNRLPGVIEGGKLLRGSRCWGCCTIMPSCGCEDTSPVEQETPSSLARERSCSGAPRVLLPDVMALVGKGGGVRTGEFGGCVLRNLGSFDGHSERDFGPVSRSPGPKPGRFGPLRSKRAGFIARPRRNLGTQKWAGRTGNRAEICVGWLSKLRKSEAFRAPIVYAKSVGLRVFADGNPNQNSGHFTGRPAHLCGARFRLG